MVWGFGSKQLVCTLQVWTNLWKASKLAHWCREIRMTKRNVYLHISEDIHLEARALALRLRRTTESLYLEGILRVLGEHGIHVEGPPSVDLTPCVAEAIKAALFDLGG